MVKYPVQSIIAGTLLLGLAFSLNDGSSAETRKNVALVACHNESAWAKGSDSLQPERCLQVAAKK